MGETKIEALHRYIGREVREPTTQLDQLTIDENVYYEGYLQGMIDSLEMVSQWLMVQR